MLNPLNLDTLVGNASSQILSLESLAKSTFLLQRFKKLERNICHENRHLLSLLLLEHLGDPSRNIQMLKSLLITAKEKSRPELSARYLIRNLFTEEVLSSVRGNLECGALPERSIKLMLFEVCYMLSM